MKKIAIGLLLCGVLGSSGALVTLVISATVLEGQARPAVVAAGAVGTVVGFAVIVLGALVLRAGLQPDARAPEPAPGLAARFIVVLSAAFAGAASATIPALLQWDPVPLTAIAITAGVAAALAAVAAITALAKMPSR
ncbi:ascorbate-specific PTS system EIIC-type component UlaA [Leifsonia sp. AK011]|uniref:hypothetical protein n=1 Tax=Leifsonia sp. AK011 TaxID=2723075 RepID=UPI0015C6F3C2|nr:hypothetical protein [Leifsonia sp. AK011]NYF09811.1 ascorbate-specific PTS system EIIC-type component UlaA [Leifsonia sp. AK011]